MKEKSIRFRRGCEEVSKKSFIEYIDSEFR